MLKKNKQPPAPASVSKINMGPDDILVVHVDTETSHMSAEEFSKYGDHLMAALKGLKVIDTGRVLIVPSNIKLSVLSPDSPEYKLVVGAKKP